MVQRNASTSSAASPSPTPAPISAAGHGGRSRSRDGPIGARCQHHREQQQHHDRAEVDQHLDPGDQLGAEHEVEAGDRAEADHQVETGADRWVLVTTRAPEPTAMIPSASKKRVRDGSRSALLLRLRRAGFRRSRTGLRPGRAGFGRGRTGLRPSRTGLRGRRRRNGLGWVGGRRVAVRRRCCGCRRRAPYRRSGFAPSRRCPGRTALRAAVASSLDGSPSTSCAGGGGPSAIQAASRSLSCSRPRTSCSAYSNSGDQCRASNGQTSMQMPPVHAESEVDVEPVEHVVLPRGARRPGSRPLPCASRCRCTSPGAPRRAAEHADRAVLLEQRDHAPAARRKLRLDVRVLPGRRPLGHRLERDGEAIDQALPGTLRSPSSLTRTYPAPSVNPRRAPPDRSSGTVR